MCVCLPCPSRSSRPEAVASWRLRCREASSCQTRACLLSSPRGTAPSTRTAAAVSRPWARPRSSWVCGHDLKGHCKHSVVSETPKYQCYEVPVAKATTLAGKREIGKMGLTLNGMVCFGALPERLERVVCTYGPEGTIDPVCTYRSSGG